MSNDKNKVTSSLTVIVDEEKNKLLYAEADNHVVDTLLTFLTWPLGKIIKLLKKHHGDEAPTLGSLSSLYHSLENLDSSHFVTGDVKNTLLDPTSSFEADFEWLKLYYTWPAECYFRCSKCNRNSFRSVSIYFDKLRYCHRCRAYDSMMSVAVAAAKRPEADSEYGVFAIHKSSFIITDDLHILPNDTGLLRIRDVLGIADTCKAKKIKVDFGCIEMMNLLKASLTSSPTPLSDVVLNKITQMKYSAILKSQSNISLHQIANEESPNPRNISLKLMIQKSSGKLLYAEAKEDFVDFLFSLLIIPLGGVEHLLEGKTCFKAIDNLYHTTTNVMDNKYFKTTNIKNRLAKPNLPHGYISKDHILPLTEEVLPADYSDLSVFSSVKFPKGQGIYLDGPQTYQVKDDLTVTPFCIASILSSLNEQKIALSDVEEMLVQIGLKEGLSILEASLTSTSALSDTLLTHTPNKRQKREV